MRRSSILTLLVALVLGGVPAGDPPRAAPAASPNIVLLVLDDVDLALGSLDYMPRAQALLVAAGTSFPHFVVPTPLCCPSRASFLTGRYAHNHQVLTVAPPWGGFVRAQQVGFDRETLATALQAQGYRTALLGKYFNGYPRDQKPSYVPPGWDAWLVPLGFAGYGQFDYEVNDDGVVVAHGSAAKDYFGDVIARRAVEFVRDAGESGEPFFLFFAPVAAHKPAIPAPRHARLFRRLRAPRTPSFDEADVSDKPPHIRVLPRLTRADVRAIDDLYRQRVRTLQAADEAIAALVGALADGGLLDRTYVFLTSDNGFHMGQHRLRPAKASPYEEDVRVPLVVVGPGVPPARSLRHLVSGVDLAPTLAELAGAPLAAADGRSLVPLLVAAPPPAWAFRQVALLERLPFKISGGAPASLTAAARALAAELNLLAEEDAAAPEPGWRALRNRDWKYVEWATGDRELYDLVADPSELDNLASSAPPEVVDGLAERLAALQSCAGEDCRREETLPLPKRRR
jgi:arylsulfatase A-like enzyme